MKYTIDPGRNEKVITVIDNIVYSHVTDTEGNPLDLKMSVTASFGNSELMALRGRKVPEGTEGSKLPCVIWFNGGGWRGADKNMQLADLIAAGYQELIRAVPALGAVRTDDQGVCIYLNNRFYTEKVRPGFIPSETQLKRNPLPELDAVLAFFRTALKNKIEGD